MQENLWLQQTLKWGISKNRVVMGAKIENIDWDKLKAFQVVAELGSMNAASTRLRESAPTVSRKIDDLERNLGARLLERSPRGVKLTEAGAKILKYVESMSDAVQGIYSDVKDFDQPAVGKITLATGDGIGAHWIAPNLPMFHLANPKIELHLNVVESTPNLLDGDVDIAIQFDEPAIQELVSRRLGTLHYMFFASPDYLATYGEPSSMFELSNHRLLFHKGYVQQVDRWAPNSKEFRKILDLSLVTNSGAIMMAVCANGGGIAVMPSYVSELGSSLTPLKLPEVAPIRFWLTYSERVRRLPRGQIVLEWLRTLFDSKKHIWFRDNFIHPNEMMPETELELLKTDATP